jgi:hypothetical protein
MNTKELTSGLASTRARKKNSLKSEHSLGLLANRCSNSLKTELLYMPIPFRVVHMLMHV